LRRFLSNLSLDVFDFDLPSILGKLPKRRGAGFPWPRRCARSASIWGRSVAADEAARR
jgi:hypothetical protein